MIVLNTKTFDELVSETIFELESVGFDTTPGSIAKLFMNIINKYIANAYNALSVNHLRAFVTTSDGDALDAIGSLLQCKRLKDETDDNYRYRITNQCLTLATSNETSIRLTALTTDGVDDIVIKPYAMGAGSFRVIVITDPTLPNQDEIIKNVNIALSNVSGYGIRYDVSSPTLTYVSIKQKIFFVDNISDIEKQEIRYEVQTKLSEYLSTLNIGQDIIVDEITKIIMNVSNNIIQEANVEFYINGEKALYVNQSCRWYERFVLSNDVDNVVII